MKSLIVYSSQSGNTQRLARTVYATLAADKAIYPVSEAPEPNGSDIIAVGFWLQVGQPDPQTQAYLKKIGSQKVFLFATHGAAVDSDHARQAMACARQFLPAADIIGQFNCQGEVNPKVLEKAARKQPPPAWLADAPRAAGHPDQNDLDRLQAVLSECLNQE
jgi:flavodoxin